MDLAILIVLPILTALMFELGLTLEPKDFRLIASHPKAIIAGLLGQIILLPAAAYLICGICYLPPTFALGLMLIACCPGGSSSNVFSMLAGGNVALSVTLTALSSIITLFTMPAILEWVTMLEGSTVSIQLPLGNLIIQNIVLMLIPIAAGVLTQRFAPKAAGKIHAALSKFAFPALILLAAIFFISEYKAFLENFASIGLSVSLLMVMAMLIGSLLSRGMMLNVRDRRTIVIEVGMQNAAQAIAVAGSPFVFNNAAIAIPAIVYALIMNLALLSYVGIIRRKNSLSNPQDI